MAKPSPSIPVSAVSSLSHAIVATRRVAVALELYVEAAVIGEREQSLRYLCECNAHGVRRCQALGRTLCYCTGSVIYWQLRA